jgi:hypothetical protein
MRAIRLAFTLVAALALVSGCAASQSPAAADPTPMARAAQALMAGAEAFETDDANTLRAASGVLDDLGARPAPGEPDLVQAWSVRARALGAAAVPPRGRTAGPAYRDGVLAAGEATAFNDMFHSGRLAIVSVAPRGGTAFTLRVENAQGVEICSEFAGDSPAQCRWTPIWTEQVRIEIVNRSGGRAQYFLLTN